MASNTEITDIIALFDIDSELRQIATKIANEERINTKECLALFQTNHLGLLGFLADIVRKRQNGDFAFF
jgi:aminodeoxyfutalosine synthase